MTDEDAAELEGVTFTNPQRVLWPEQGITKFALASDPVADVSGGGGEVGGGSP